MKNDIVTVKEDELIDKPVMLFGKDVREIQCFRNSFITGICCGVGVGLGCFLFTSKVRFSTQMSFTFLWIGVLCYWIPCRYKYESSLFLIEAAKAGKLVKKNRDNTAKDT